MRRGMALCIGTCDAAVQVGRPLLQRRCPWQRSPCAACFCRRLSPLVRAITPELASYSLSSPAPSSLPAAGLDMLSCHFGDDLLPIILPIVQQRLGDADWRARESGKPATPPSLYAGSCLLTSCHQQPSQNQQIQSQVLPPPVLGAAILALGAVSNGCATGLAPFLPEMVAMLLPTLKDPRPMVRCIR